jgi:hypothetical protein
MKKFLVFHRERVVDVDEGTALILPPVGKEALILKRAVHSAQD